MERLVFFGLPALILICGIVLYRVQRAGFRTLLETLARRRGGTVAAGPWFLFPRLVLRVDGAELSVSARFGNGEAGRRCTFAWIAYPEAQLPALDLRRRPKRVGMLEKQGRGSTATGHPAFDQAFWLHAEDARSASAFLDRDLRRALLAFEPRSGVRLRLGTTHAYRGGLPKPDLEPSLEVAVGGVSKDRAELERLIELATQVHDRLRREARTRAA